MVKYNNCKLYTFRERYGIVHKNRYTFLQHKGYDIIQWEYSGGKNLSYVKNFIDTMSINNYEIVYYTSKKGGLSSKQIVVALRKL